MVRLPETCLACFCSQGMHGTTAGDGGVINHPNEVYHMGVSKNRGTPKSSILIGFSIINHPFWGPTPIFGNTHMDGIFLTIPDQCIYKLQSQNLLGVKFYRTIFVTAKVIFQGSGY